MQSDGNVLCALVADHPPQISQARWKQRTKLIDEDLHEPLVLVKCLYQEQLMSSA
jgi:hypothetical protein